MNKINSFTEFELLKEKILLDKKLTKQIISICSGTGCSTSGAKDVYEEIKNKIKKYNLENKVDILTTGCHGFCERGPLLVIYPEKIFYQQVKKEDVDEIIKETIINKRIVERLLYTNPITGEKIIKETDVPFYKKQTRLLLDNNGKIDPTNINDYISIGGYSSLIKALKMKPEDIIEEIKKSGLRGRGGAGFPTGKKWETTKKFVEEYKQKFKTTIGGYVICNADEGDPGAFMDRSLLEGNPHSVIEGMTIGAYAIGVNYGIIYIRNEYPLAVKHLKIALQQAKEYGFLGENILGTDFNFDINITRGAGAFVCGEETSLLESIQGKIGEPRPKPPYPAQNGLWNLPTNINNVKTWASVSLIINNGSDWYSNIGTETSKGTMIFSLVGKINNTGLIEVPMGITLREIIYDIGAGIPNNKKFKAVQTGGPSGGCIPESLLDTPIDYESLTQAGSMMGSGGMIVMDENTCMVEVARYFLAFTQDESCGKCTPCREGTKQMLEILTNITNGKGKLEDLELLIELGNEIKKTSLCALGGTAPNPVLTTLKYFKDEYIAHIIDKKCPAKVCKSLIKYRILQEKCSGCMLCLKICPVNAISGERKKPHIIDQQKCSKCGSCFDICRFSAIIIE